MHVCEHCGLLGYWDKARGHAVCPSTKSASHMARMQLPYACKLLFQVRLLSGILPSSRLSHKAIAQRASAQRMELHCLCELQFHGCCYFHRAPIGSRSQTPLNHAMRDGFSTLLGDQQHASMYEELEPELRCVGACRNYSP